MMEERRCSAGSDTQEKGQAACGCESLGQLWCSDQCTGRFQDPKRREQGKIKAQSYAF